MELNIAVIDDLEADRERIRLLASRVSFKNNSLNVTCFESADSFFKAYRKGSYHVVFLDICLCREHEQFDFPQKRIVSGISMSRQLRQIDEDIAIIFMSTTKEFVFDTFAVQPFEYMIKPVSDHRFEEVINKVMNHFSASVKEIEIRLTGSVISIPIRDIMQICSGQHVVCLKMITGKQFECKMTYSEIHDQLINEPNFIECNRGVMINMDYAVNIHDCCFVMQDGDLCSIRVREKKKIADRFTAYTADKLQGGFFT